MYSSVTMLIQYLLPTITISVAYYQILGQLRMRLKQKKSQVMAAIQRNNNKPDMSTNPLLLIKNGVVVNEGKYFHKK